MKSLTDVLILGGGIVGCAIADELSRRGARVTLADPRGIGQGATQASAGMLAPFTEGLHDPVLQSLGSESLETVRCVRSGVLRTDGHDARLRQDGSIDVALDAANAAAMLGGASRGVVARRHRAPAAGWRRPRASSNRRWPRTRRRR